MRSQQGLRDLLIATRNRGKYPEIRMELRDLPFSLLDLNNIATLADFDVEEPAATFEGNAIIKAFMYGMRAGVLTLADDSGIEVDALDGAPGVLSARYAEGTDEDRMLRLLADVQDIPDGERGAQFRSVIAIYDPAGKVRTCEGVCRGRLLRAPEGTGGFGYDPIFFSDELGMGFAEASLEEKNRVSHRGKALAKARDILLAEFA